MSKPNPLQLLGTALLKASEALSEVPIAADLRRSTAQVMGHLLDDQVLPRYRAQVNQLITDQLRRHPDFPLDGVVANLLDHQHLVLQGVYTHWLALGAGRCDFDVRLAMTVTPTDNLELVLTIDEITARPTGLIGLFTPPLDEADVRQRVIDKLRQLPADQRVRVEDGAIVLNVWRELQSLWEQRFRK